MYTTPLIRTLGRFLALWLCLVQPLMAQTLTDGPIRLRIRVKELRANFVNSADNTQAYTWNVWARDAADVDAFDWVGPSCFTQDVVPLAGVEQVFLPDATNDANVVFDVQYPCATVPRFIDLRLEGFEDNVSDRCVADAGDSGVIQANPLALGLDYRLGAPGVWFAHPVVYTTALGNNGTGLGAYAIIVETNYEFVGSPLALSLNSTSVSCAGASNGSVTATVSGGLSGNYTYVWNPTLPNSPTASGLAAGLYQLTVIDGNNCQVSGSVQVGSPQPLVASVTAVTNVACFGASTGAATLSVSGGTGSYTFQWNPSVSTTQNLANIPANVYTYTVTDANNCTATGSVEITQPTALNVTATATSVGCFGEATGQVTISAGGGVPAYSYLFNGTPVPSNTIGNLATGVYTITVIDANTCSEGTTVVVNQSAAPISISTAKQDVSCNGGTNGSIDVLVSGGTGTYTYIWSAPGLNGPVVSNLAAGTYQLTVLDANNCSATASIVVSQPQALTAQVQSSNISCFAAQDGNITLLVSGGSGNYSYNWTGPAGFTSVNSPVLTNLGPGTYVGTVTDNNNCTLTSAPIQIAEPAELQLTVNATNASCANAANGVLAIALSGGVNPQLFSIVDANNVQYPLTAVLTDLNPGVYTVTAQDANGCTKIQTATIAEPAPLQVTLATQNVTCFGLANGSIQATVTGGTGAYTYQWTGNASITDVLANGGANTYTVTVVDANGCIVSASATITQPAALTASATSTNPKCNGDNNGTINLLPAGGTPPYAYNWTSVGGFTSSDQNLVALSPDTYTGVITDANGCTFSASITITQPQPFTFVKDSTLVTCANQTNGSISLVFTGGTLPYNLTVGQSNTLVTNNNAQVFSNLGSGLYTFTAVDANGCSVAGSVNLPEVLPLTASLLVTQPISCAGAADGAVQVTAAGGNGGYTYNWNDGNGTVTTDTRTGLNPGIINVTVTDSKGCQATATLTLQQPNPLTLALTSTNITCNGQANGSVSSTVSGGTGVYTYQWSGASAATTANLSGQGPGVYTLTVTDANGCTASASATLTENPILDLTTQVNNATCNGQANGSFSYSITGGDGNYTVRVNNNVVSASPVTGLGAGTYFVEVVDGTGLCRDTSTIVITQPAPLSVSITPTNVTCFGLNNGQLEAVVTGGTGAYQYFWSTLPNPGTALVNNLSPAQYSLTVFDANGCSATATATITQPAALAATFNVTNVTCNGQNNGAISTVITGGVNPYQISWQGQGSLTYSSSLQNISALAPGSYLFTVTDANGCTFSQTLTVTEPTPVDIQVNSVNPTCFGQANGSVSLTVSGGVPGYQIFFNTTLLPAGQTQVNNLGAGTYTISVVDAQGCPPFTQSVTLTQPAVLTAVINKTDVTCFGAADGSATVVATGGTAPYTYLWTGGTNTTDTQSNAGPGVYAVLVTDAQGCTVNVSTQINTPNLLTASVTKTDVTCNGLGNGAVNLTVAGGNIPYTYLWSSGQTTEDISGVPAGTYSVTVTDAKGCTATAEAVVAEPAVLALTLTQTDVTCFAFGNATVDATVTGGNGGNVFSWQGPNSTTFATEDLSNVGPGTYILFVTDSKGCSVNGSVTITQPAQLAVQLQITPIACNDSANGKIKAIVTGGTGSYTYLWNVTNQPTDRDSVEKLNPGTYTVQVQDQNGCIVTASAILTQPTPLVLSETHVNVSCKDAADGLINLSVSGATPPYQYLWSDGVTTQDRTGLAPGLYTVLVSDSKGCRDSLSVTITEPDLLSITGVVTSPSCFGFNNGAIDITVTGGTAPYAYQWQGAQQVFVEDQPALVAGTYFVKVTDARGCIVNAEFQVTQPDALQASLNVQQISCFGLNNASIEVVASGGTAPYQYNWNPPAPNVAQLTGLAPGSYTVQVVDANGCSVNLSAGIFQPNLLTVTLATTQITCNGNLDGAIDATATGGTGQLLYQWSGASTSTAQDLSGLGAGNYTLTVTDQNGCTATASTTIIEPSNLVVTTTKTDAKPCPNNLGSITVTVSGGTTPYTFLWNDQANTQNRTNLAGGTYTVVVTDAKGCFRTATVTIDAAVPMQLTFTKTDVNCIDQPNGSATVTVTGGQAPYNFQWTSGALTSTASNLAPNNYTVLVTDANQCTVTGQVTILPPNPNNPNAPALTFVQGTHVQKANVTCKGAADGRFILSPVGGTPPYEYSLNGGAFQSSPIFENLPPSNTYKLVVRDSKGCTKELVNAAGQPVLETITEPFLPLTLTFATSNVSCFGLSDGIINLTAQGGTGTAYQYSWSNGAVTEDLVGIPAGLYTVTVRDLNNCSASVSIQITQPASYSISFSVKNVSCHAGADGEIDLTVSGGNQPLTYTWYRDGDLFPIPGLSNVEDPNNLTAGIYRVEIQGTNSSCLQEVLITVVEPQPFVFTSIETSISCNGAPDGAIQAAVTGGTGPYSYQLQFPDGSLSTPVPFANYTNLPSGLYILRATDARGCTAIANISLSQPSLLNLTLTRTDVSCAGFSNGTITANIQGGTPPYQYSRNGVTFQPTPTFANLAAGQYIIQVKDANGCTVQDTITILAPTPITYTTAATPALCHSQASGTITVTADGGTPPYQYSKNNGLTYQTSPVFDALTAGIYFIVVKDANGCELAKTQQVTQPTPLKVNATGGRVSCFGSADGIIKVTGQGGVPPYEFSLNAVNYAPVSQFSGRPALPDYVVYIRDANGCVATTVVAVTSPDSLVLSLTKTNPTCAGEDNGRIRASVTGGTAPFVYRVNNKVFNPVEGAKDLTQGVYTITVTDAKGCTATVVDTLVEQFPNFGITFDIPATIQTGETFVVSGDGANSYTWDFGTDARPQTAIGSPTQTVFVNPGEQEIKIRVLLGGCFYTFTRTVTVTGTPVSVAPVLDAASVRVYPNPAQGAFQVQVLNYTGVTRVSLYTTLGQEVLTESWSDSEGLVDVSALAKGVYSLRITTDQGSLTQKLVVR
jgi:hypothetical protein